MGRMGKTGSVKGRVSEKIQESEMKKRGTEEKLENARK
jgi:hypothetical protein